MEDNVYMDDAEKAVNAHRIMCGKLDAPTTHIELGDRCHRAHLIWGSNPQQTKLFYSGAEYLDFASSYHSDPILYRSFRGVI